MKRRLSFH